MLRLEDLLGRRPELVSSGHQGEPPGGTKETFGGLHGAGNLMEIRWKSMGYYGIFWDILGYSGISDYYIDGPSMFMGLS